MGNPVEYYPLTHPQKAIWYTEKIHPSTSIGNIAATLRLKGKIDYPLLERAINLFVEKNDAIRLRIIEHDGQPRQYISDYKFYKPEFFDFSGYENPVQELFKWDQQLTQIPFQLIDSDLFYFALVRISDNDGGIYVKNHHLVSDAWTMTLMANQIIEYYIQLKNGESVSAENMPSYVEYVLSESAYIVSEKFKKDRKFWNSRFDSIYEITTLKSHDASYKSTKARRKTFVIPAKLTSQIHKYCKESKV